MAEAKRRTIFTVYYLENIYNFQNGSPSYLGEELALLPAPHDKWLWNALDRGAWEMEYDAFLRSWEGKPSLKLAEFWPQHTSKEPGAAERRVTRVDRWAETMDEFGMLLLAVCTASYDS